MSAPVVRELAAADVPAVTAIYAESVANGRGTFELEAPDAAEMTRRLAADRTVTRRVQAALDRWRLIADDSAGQPLPLTAAGLFLRHVAELPLAALDIVALLVLLKHPLALTGSPLVGANEARLLARDLPADDEAERRRPLLDQPPPEAGGPVVQLLRGGEHPLASLAADAGHVVQRPRDRLPRDPGAGGDVDDRRPPALPAHRDGERRSSQAISWALSSTPSPRVEERISPMLRGPNRAKVGNCWCSTKASAIAVAGTPRSAPSSSARARRSKFASL